MNKQWLDALLQSFIDNDAVEKFYADEFEFHDYPLEHHVVNDKEKLKRMFQVFANRDPDNGMGIHEFEVADFKVSGNTCLWQFNWRASHTQSFFGIPTNGKTLETNGMSYQIYNDDKKIIWEAVHSDQVHVFKQLGMPIDIVHYWED